MQAGGFCYLPDGSRLGKAIRKEYRTLTDEERKRFHEALIKLKKSGEYDKLALIHGKAAVSGGAHSGPAFLPWHREFLKRYHKYIVLSLMIRTRIKPASNQSLFSEYCLFS